MLKTRVYLHSDKETMWELGERLGLKGDALSMFRHALTEVEIELIVDPLTGLADITAVDGYKIDKETN